MNTMEKGEFRKIFLTPVIFVTYTEGLSRSETPFFYKRGITKLGHSF